MSATQRLARANEFAERLQSIRRNHAKAMAALALIDEQVDALAFDIVREQAAAKEALLDEHAHHMDPHPTAVLGVVR